MKMSCKTQVDPDFDEWKCEAMTGSISILEVCISMHLVLDEDFESDVFKLGANT